MDNNEAPSTSNIFNTRLTSRISYELKKRAAAHLDIESPLSMFLCEDTNYLHYTGLPKDDAERDKILNAAAQNDSATASTSGENAQSILHTAETMINPNDLMSEESDSDDEIGDKNVHRINMSLSTQKRILGRYGQAEYEIKKIHSQWYDKELNCLVYDVTFKEMRCVIPCYDVSADDDILKDVPFVETDTPRLSDIIDAQLEEKERYQDLIRIYNPRNDRSGYYMCPLCESCKGQYRNVLRHIRGEKKKNSTGYSRYPCYYRLRKTLKGSGRKLSISKTAALEMEPKLVTFADYMLGRDREETEEETNEEPMVMLPD